MKILIALLGLVSISANPLELLEFNPDDYRHDEEAELAWTGGFIIRIKKHMGYCIDAKNWHRGR